MILRIAEEHREECLALLESGIQLGLCEVDLVDRQAACIEELLTLVGYLPEAQAVLAKHGIVRESTRQNAVQGEE